MLNLNCVICAELFVHSDDVHVTTCGHMFHFICLKQWMERSKSCPQCRNRCTDRNIFRVYFNLANLDVSRVDVCSLQEQLDNEKLQNSMKEKELQKAHAQIKSLKDMQKMTMKTITGLEKKLQKNDFVILSYSEQIKMLKLDSKLVEELRKEVKTMKSQIETMEGVASIMTASTKEVEKMLQTENDPRKLCAWVTTLKRELRHSESKRTDLRNVLKVVQNDLRKEIDQRKANEEQISRLESENYELAEKLKISERNLKTGMVSPKKTAAGTSCTTANTKICNCGGRQPPITVLGLLGEIANERRQTISPATKANIKQIEESNSPYLNIKSSSVGLVPLFKRITEGQLGSDVATKTTTKLATLKISPAKSADSTASSKGAALRKTTSDITERYSIFKKPRLGFTAAGMTTKPLVPQGFVFNGFGGTERVDPFVNVSDEEVEENAVKPQATTVPKRNIANLNNRLKAGGLRNFKINK